MNSLDLSPLTELVHRLVGREVSWRAIPMPGGASTRKFFRILVEDPASSAVAFYVSDVNRSDEIDKTDGVRQRWPFLEIRDLLEANGVCVPTIVADGTARGWLLVEDLGDDTLAAYLARHPTSKEMLYRIAVCDLAKAQRALESVPHECVVSRRAFDEDLILWEMHHFREWALEARGVVLCAEDRAIFDGVAERLARKIASWPRVFVHRDYQSRNLMVREQAEGGGHQLIWIDFQDALMGPRVYDLVALLNDSYQTFDRSFVESRLDDFATARGFASQEREILGYEFDVVTVQRKLKDAGRFVYLERAKANASFLPFVEPTIVKARLSLARLRSDHDGDMKALAGLLDRLLS